MVDDVVEVVLADRVCGRGRRSRDGTGGLSRVQRQHRGHEESRDNDVEEGHAGWSEK